MKLKTYIMMPKVQMALALFSIFLSSFVMFPNKVLPILGTFFLSLVCTVGTDLLLLRIRKGITIFPSASLVTSLIITLLTSYSLHLYIVILVSIVSVASKHFLHVKGRHIFNPASFGLFFVGLLFHVPVSWWAVSYQDVLQKDVKTFVLFLILLLPLYVSMYRMKRYMITLSFLCWYVFFEIVTGQSFKSLVYFIDPTVLFFATVMLPEPRTSPNEKKKQILFGSIVAFISVVVVTLLFKVSGAIPMPDPLLFGLLIANLLFSFT